VRFEFKHRQFSAGRRCGSARYIQTERKLLMAETAPTVTVADNDWFDLKTGLSSATDKAGNGVVRHNPHKMCISEKMVEPTCTTKVVKKSDIPTCLKVLVFRFCKSPGPPWALHLRAR
jgi:hypothetical protein